MARANLRYAFAIDRDVHDASEVDPTLFDPVVRVDGGLPGAALPFCVVRYYRGPQGRYVERFVLTDPRGTERAGSVARRVELGGQMTEDRFSSTLRGVQLDSDEEHHLTFYLDDEEVGSVPVFVEAGRKDDAAMPLAQRFKAALYQADALTVRVRGFDGGRSEQTVWFVNEGGRLYVVTGPGEQEVPGLADAGDVHVAVHDGSVEDQAVEVAADARLVPPGDPAYYAFVASVLRGETPAADAGRALRRWAQDCQLVELTPRLDDGVPADARDPADTAGPAGAAASAEAGASDVSVSGQAVGPGPGSRDTRPHPDAGRTDVQMDQDVYERLIAAGKSERLARSKAKAAYVRAEKQRLVGERSV